jgi:hypothetical protein
MRQTFIILAAAALAGCGQSAQGPAANEAANQAAAPKEKTPYCFFKDEEAKGWSATAGKDGNIVVKGKLYREDPRYKAVLEKPKVTGSVAEAWPGIAPNDTGYAAQDNWWDVSLTVPGSAAASRVQVRCGGKIFADLSVERGKK